MMRQALDFLLDVLVQPFAVILLLRFHLQWLHAPLRNPIGEFIMALTNFVVLRTRRYIPSFKSYDTSSLLLAYIFETLYLYLYSFISIYTPPEGNNMLPVLLAVGIVQLISLTVIMLIVALIIQAVMSWVNPHTPLEPILNVVTSPLLKPLQRRIPRAGDVDMSSYILIIILVLIYMIPIYYLDKLLRSFI
jgi:YggT family protein